MSTDVDEKVTQEAFHGLRQGVADLDLEAPTGQEWREFLEHQEFRVRHQDNLTDARKLSLLRRLQAARSEPVPDGATFFALENVLGEVQARAAKANRPAPPPPDPHTAARAELAGRLEEQFPDVDIALGGHHDVLVVSKIVVPQQVRGQGQGGKVMAEMCRFADERGLTLALTPSADFGGTVSRLRTFYRRFGFVNNSGRGRDYAISETMLRRPGAGTP